MKSSLFIITSLLSLSLAQSDKHTYISKEYGFASDFPGKVEIDRLDKYSHSFTTFESIGDEFIFYQVQVLDERPGSPLQFRTKEEYSIFLNNFLKTSQHQYDRPKNIYTKVKLYEGKYHSLDYKFSGLWKVVGPGIPVYSWGKTILHNKRLKRISIVFSQGLGNNALVRKKCEDFLGSFRLLE
jgi:hypothetical protein